MSDSTPSTSARAVFLSYASQDAAAALRLCEALRAAGVEVWFDQSELRGGDAWDQKIRKQIKECALFVPVISANTNARPEGYFRLEWKLAVDRSHLISDDHPFLFPVVIDDTTDAAARVPDRFRETQWTRLNVKETPESLATRVAQLLGGRSSTGRLPTEASAVDPLALTNSALLSAAYVTASANAPLSSGGDARGARNQRTVAVAGVVVAALLVAVIAFILRRREPTVAATPAARGTSTTLAADAEFPHDPDLKRVYQLLYNVVDGIAEDFALMDDIVKPLLAARPNDPEVVTVAAELAQEFVTRGFDISPARRAEAKRLTERAQQLAPDNPEALAALGYYLGSTRTQLDRAEEALRRAIALKPHEPRFRCFLYDVLIASRKPTAEIDAFGDAMVAEFPKYPMIPYLIASHHAATGNLAAAEQWFDRTLALAPVPMAITSKAEFMLEVHGDVDGMKHWLDQMPERQRTNARLLNLYNVQAIVTGQTAAARRLLDSMSETWLADGTYIFPKALLVAQLEQLDGNADVARLQFEAAEKEVQKRQAADLTDLRPQRAELWVQIGLGHRDEARAALRINLQKAPRPYHWNLGMVWWTGAPRACLLLDERTQALALLKEACTEPVGRQLLRNLFRVDPQMAPFRSDPEIIALLGEPTKEMSATAAN